MSESKQAAAELLLLLAAFWQSPDEVFFTELVNGSIDSEIARLVTQAGYRPWWRNTGQFQSATPSFPTLQSFYFTYLGGAGKASVLPVESLYKRWTEDPTVRLPIAGSTGYLMGDAAMHVQYLLESYGLSLPAAYRMMPDHLVLLLELAAFLLEHRTPEESRLFINQHFDWLDALSKSLASLQLEADTELQFQKFYQLALQTLQETVACELKRETNN